MTLSNVERYQVVVVGAGAAGLMATAQAAARGLRVVLLEKNTKPGVKILMSGGTRCNLTHATDARGIGNAFPRQQARFLRGPLAAFGPDQVVEFFESLGVETKTEDTGKIFPRSDRALDVQRALVHFAVSSGAEIQLGQSVTEICKVTDGLVVSTETDSYPADDVILTTGGQSYPGCGTTGDGYAWAKLLGHSIVPPRPSLVPIRCDAAWTGDLQGVTIPDVGFSVIDRADNKPMHTGRGSLLFTHFGVSGPVAMNASRELTSPNRRLKDCRVQIDLSPNMHADAISALLQRTAESDGRREVAKTLAAHMPLSVARVLVGFAELPPAKTLAELKRDSRQRLAELTKRFPIDISGTLGFAKAEVTAGGVALDEVDSRDMQSKLCRGLYLAGEILDVDGPIGGYNFQAAFSTGWLAGQSVAAG